MRAVQDVAAGAGSDAGEADNVGSGAGEADNVDNDEVIRSYYAAVKKLEPLLIADNVAMSYVIDKNAAQESAKASMRQVKLARTQIERNECDEAVKTRMTAYDSAHPRSVVYTCYANGTNLRKDKMNTLLEHWHACDSSEEEDLSSFRRIFNCRGE